MIRLRMLSLGLAAFFLLCPAITQAQFGLKTTPDVKTALAVSQPPKASVQKSSDVPIETARSEISVELVKAATAAQRKGDITRLQLLRIKVAMLSPAFRQKVEDLAVLQMAASGEDGPFEVDENGEIVRETINWEGLATFLEKLVPLVLLLIKAFGG
ncbi:hypothetical protein SH449x_004100 [Pirellulaceae bacterium SH449]